MESIKGGWVKPQNPKLIFHMREEMQRGHDKARYLEGHGVLSCKAGQLFEKAFWKVRLYEFPSSK